MRAKNYRENIVSEYVEDYINPKTHQLMKTELTSGCKMVTEEVMRYIDLIATDLSAEACSPVDQEALKECFKNTFGISANIVYKQIPVNYAETFGPTKIEENGIKGKGYYLYQPAIIKFLISLAHSSEAEAPPFNVLTGDDIARLATPAINGYPVKSDAGALTLTFVKTETPTLGNPYSFASHAHEWAHQFGLGHHYEVGVADPKPYGLYCPLGLYFSDILPEKKMKTGKMIDPLMAYQLEPKEGFVFPELILGDAYFNYLLNIGTTELPYTPNPKPEISIQTKTVSYLGLATILNIKIKNIGNIPLSYLTFKVNIAANANLRLTEKEQKAINIDWIEIGEEKTFNFRLLNKTTKPMVKVSLDPPIKEINIE
ncbi:MAG: hypothetical protein NT099_04750 [Candidatus Saganbacteria bacterium]|nr:hypothetical protein [Candidatus Saganbacteria bacterium]